MLFNRPAIQFRQFGGWPIRAIARRDPIAPERRLIGSRFRSSVIRKPRGFALTHWRRPLSLGQAACDSIRGFGSQVMCLPDHPNQSLYVYMPSDKHERPY
jgi:hypothetical protein